jgi:hypothetical protein
MTERIVLTRGLPIAAVMFATVVTLVFGPMAHASPRTSQAQARDLSTGCEPNGLPHSLALCDGSGRVNVQLEGTAVLRVLDGRVTLKGQAKRVCVRKRVKRKNGTFVMRRVCKRTKPILPKIDTRKSRGYTIYSGERLFFFLPAGKWRISARGQGMSISAVGEGRVGVKAEPQPRDEVVPASLISVGGQVYDAWPRRWARFDFGRDAEPDVPSQDSTSGDTTSRTKISSVGGGSVDPESSGENESTDDGTSSGKSSDGTSAKGVVTAYSSTTEVPIQHG